MKTNTLLARLFLLVSALLFSAGFMTASPPVVMKLLIIAWDANDISYQALTRDLGQIGVPYQSVFLNNITPDGTGSRLSGLTLVDTANGRGLYQGIIETDSSFTVCTTSCSTLLSATDITKLNNYAVQYSVRMVCYYGWPEPSWGLQPADGGAAYTPASPLNVTLTSAGASVFSYLNPTATVPVSGQGGPIWAYKALPTAAANETTTPLLMSGSNTVAVTHTTADGRETMALTMDNYPGYLHSTAFSYGVMNWVTKGVFLGSRRVYLNPEIDDMLLGNRLYDPQNPICPGDESCPTVFATGDDLQAIADWQAGLQSDPQFQTFYNTFAYNGIGTTWFPLTDSIFTKIKELNTRFVWLSHTWDHSNLDCYTTTAQGVCVPATLDQSLAELNQNIAIASTLGVTLNRTDMVTPYNGGLTNPAFLQAAASVGIQNTVYNGDPPGTQLGVVNPLVPSIFQFTRRVPDLFDDVSSPLTGVPGSWPDEYNATYGPGGATPIYSQNQTYTQIIDIESSKIFNNNMITYEPYPLAFHIDNMSLYDGTHSMYTDLMNAAIAKYKAIFTLPVLTLDQSAIAPILKTRASFNNSGVVGVYTPGVNVTLTTTSTSASTIPVTGACAESACATYAGQIQDNVAVAAHSTVTLSLTAAQGTALSGITLNPASVAGGTPSTGTVTLASPAPSGGASVSLSSSNSAAVAPASVTVPGGSTTANFTITTSSVSASTTSTISASYNNVTKSASLAITAPIALSTVSLNPASVARGASSTGTVTLTSAAPAGGLSVSLASNNTAASVPASVTIAAGSTTASFTVTTTAGTAAASATITASYNGVPKTTTLTMTVAAAALSSVSLTPTSVVRGNPSTGTVTLTTAAPTSGIVVTLSSSNAAATVPASVTVAAGSTTATFTITTTAGTTAVSSTITARYNTVSKTASLSMTASAALSSVSLSPASVVRGASSTGTIHLTSAAPTGGIIVTLSSSNTAATVPASVTVTAGATTATFTITTTAGGSAATATITARYSTVSKTANLTMTAPVFLSALSVSPASVKGGTSATGAITLISAAPAGGVTVTLRSNSTAATVPASVVIPAGGATATFTVTTRTTLVAHQVTLTATQGSTSKTATLSITR